MNLFRISNLNILIAINFILFFILIYLFSQIIGNYYITYAQKPLEEYIPKQESFQPNEVKAILLKFKEDENNKITSQHKIHIILFIIILIQFSCFFSYFFIKIQQIRKDRCAPGNKDTPLLHT